MTYSFNPPVGESSMSAGSRPVWVLPQTTIAFDKAPRFMGILNVTPDSFSDGGRYVDTGKALEQAERLVAEGADIIDVGGESTRPNAVPVGEEEEAGRVLPVVERLAKSISVPISIDTYKAEVARKGMDLGAQIINDISGLTFDPRMVEVCARTKAGVVCMHIQGRPQTMQANPHYEDVVEEIRNWLSERIENLVAGGIRREAIVLDPGIGFGKTAEHNVQILQNIRAFQELGHPILIGHSRKRFLGKLLNRSVEERGMGTVGVSLGLAAQGVEILRLHEVAPTRDCLTAFRAIRPDR